MSNNHTRPDVVWIDGVGGLALATANSLSIGRDADLSIVANLPRVAGTLHRRGEDWFWSDGDVADAKSMRMLDADALLPLPGDVKCVIRRPSHLNATRRLELLRPHRWVGGVDVVLLVSKIATIGPTQSDSVCALDLEQTLFLSTINDPMTVRCEREALALEHGKAVSVGPLAMMLRSWDV